MRSFLISTLSLGMAACTPLSSPGAAPNPHSATSASSREQFSDRFDRAQLDKDEGALQRMVADELVFIDSSGSRLGKAEFIAGWTGPDDAYDPIILVDRVIVPLGPDAFLASAETTLRGTSGGKRFSSRFRFTDTFKRISGEWRTVHIQVTRIPDQPPA